MSFTLDDTRDYRAIIERTVNFVKNFNDKKQTIDAYIYDQLGDVGSKDCHPDNLFLSQVLYGCVRHKDALKAFMLHFLHDRAAEAARADYGLYLVAAYLCLYRLPDLGWARLRNLLEAVEPNKMAALVGYLSEPNGLETGVQAEWNKLYDMGFVEGHMLGPLRERADELEDLLGKLRHRAFGLQRAREAAETRKALRTGGSERPGSRGAAAAGTAGAGGGRRSKLTVPVAPALTKPRPRRVPEPQRIDQMVVRGPEPRYLETAKTLAEVEAEKEERLARIREETLKQYGPDREFRLHQTRNTVDQLRQEVEKQRQEELKFDMKHAKPAPKYPDGGAAVRMTAAQVLREDALFKKKQAAEAAAVKAYEAELRDATEFQRWQTDMRAEDRAVELQRVEAKRLFAREAALAAQEAMAKQRADNAELAGRVKDEKRAMADQRHLEEEVGQMVREQLAREVAREEREAPAAARQRLLDERRGNRARLQAEAEARARERAAREEREREERADLIRKLRAMAVLEKKVKVFDPTESAGMGLLEEMSLVELRERLEINKVRQREVEREKRSGIAQAKMGRQRDLQERLGNIQRLRQSAAQANADAKARRRAKEAAAAAAQEARREAGNERLLGELGALAAGRRAQAQALREEDARRQKEAHFQGAAAGAREAERFAELLRGAEREAAGRQAHALQAAHAYESIKAHDKKMNETAAKKRETAKQKIYAAQEEKTLKARREQLEKQKQELANKKSQFLSARTQKHSAKQKMVAHNPYAEKINKDSILISTAKNGILKPKILRSNSFTMRKSQNQESSGGEGDDGDFI